MARMHIYIYIHTSQTTTSLHTYTLDESILYIIYMMNDDMMMYVARTQLETSILARG